MKIRIGKGIVPLRRVPGDGECIDEGLYGMEAEILECRGRWIRIRMFYGYEGWIPKRTRYPWSGAEAGKKIGEWSKQRLRISNAVPTYRRRHCSGFQEVPGWRYAACVKTG